MSYPIPAQILQQRDAAHPSWHTILTSGLHAVNNANPDYLTTLANDDYLPTGNRLFAAFMQPLERIRYVLVGEGPYPRAASATGVCFMDGAVGTLWSDKGLSKPVNRATSLRNFIKMLLVADGQIAATNTGADALQAIAAKALASPQQTIQTLGELQDKLHMNGFLLLNASLVFRKHVPPVQDARAWKAFLEVVLDALLANATARQVPPATLVLWGKIAELLQSLPATKHFIQAVAEHPYNLSFIQHQGMQELFAPMQLLTRTVQTD